MMLAPGLVHRVVLVLQRTQLPMISSTSMTTSAGRVKEDTQQAALQTALRAQVRPRCTASQLEVEP